MNLAVNPDVLILATSLDPNSRSYLLAREIEQVLQQRSVNTDFIDLRTLALPLCDGSDSPMDPSVGTLREAVGRASHLLFAVPVYNWDVNAAAKNALEWLTGAELNGKTVGFLCAAGGQSSYMSVISFANSLMLDYRCWIVPRFVYAAPNDFNEDGTLSPAIIDRIHRLSVEMFSHLPVSLLANLGLETTNGS